MHLKLLGQPVAVTADRSFDLPLHKPALLLIYLAYRGGWVGREELASLFWPDADEQGARHNLRTLLMRARRLPWAADLEVEVRRLRWKVGCDVAELRDALGASDWARVVELHRGVFLSGVTVSDAPGFEAWLELERQGLLAAWRNASIRHSTDLKAEGRFAEAAMLLSENLRHDLLAEDVLAAYLEAAYLAGQRADALAAFERFRAYLGQELDLEPLPETGALAAAIRQGASLSPAIESGARSLPAALEQPVKLAGRAGELAELRSSSAALKVVAGEPGIGKSRLVAEAAPGAVWLKARDGLRNAPFHPLLSLIAERSDELPDLGPYRDDLARLAPEAAPDASPPQLEPHIARARLLEALVRLLEGFACPLVFDDLQWADANTLEVLALLSARGKREILATYRAGEESSELLAWLEALRPRGELLELRIGALDLQGTRELLGSLIGSGEGPPVFSAWLFERSAGNPFFALETLRTLFESGALEQTGKVWHSQLDELTRDYTELRLPRAVSQVISRRFERLSGGTRRLLELASVLGKDSTPDRLAPLVGLSEWAVLAGLEEAEAQGFLSGDRFAHDLLEEAVYSSLSETARRRLHGQVAERLGAELDPVATAGHWLAAGSSARAAAAFGSACKRYNALGLSEQVLELSGRALALGDSGETTAWLLYQRADALLSLKRYDEAESVLDELGKAALPLGLEIRRLVLRAHLALRRGDSQAARSSATKAVELSRDGADKDGHLDALLAYANVCALTGTQELVTPELEQAIERYRPDLRDRTLSQALCNLGWLYCGLGRFEDAEPVYREAVAAAKRSGDRYWVAWSVSNLLYCALELGDPESVLPEAEAVELLSGYDASELLQLNLIRAYQDLGRLDDAAAGLQELLASGSDPTNRTIALAALADIRFGEGRVTEGGELLARAFESLGRTDIPRARLRLSIVAIRHGDPAQREAGLRLGRSIDRRAVASFSWRELQAALAES